MNQLENTKILILEGNEKYQAELMHRLIYTQGRNWKQCALQNVDDGKDYGLIKVTEIILINVLDTTAKDNTLRTNSNGLPFSITHEH